RGFCECDRCRRLDSGEMQQEGADPESGGAGSYPVITDRVITFANQVAEAVRKAHPDKKLILFAYGPYKQPPQRVTAAGNLIIQYTMHASSHWDPAAKEKEFRELAAWAAAAKNLAVYEYLVQGATADLPRLMPELIAGS